MWLERPDELKALDAVKEYDNQWYQSSRILGAMCYVDLFAGNLEGLRDRIPYLKELGVTYLHLMPVFRTPPGDDDGGYAVSSYRELDAAFGQHGTTGRHWPPSCVITASAWCWISCSTTRRTITPGLSGRWKATWTISFLPHVPRSGIARPVRKASASDLSGRASRRLHLPQQDPPLDMDFVPQLPVGLELREPGGIQRHGRRDAVPGESGRRGIAAGRGGVHLEAVGHRLREPAGSAHDHPGVQRPGPHGGSRHGVPVGSHRASGRGGEVHRRGRMPTVLQSVADGAVVEHAGHARRQDCCTIVWPNGSAFRPAAAG
jgi:hypothetical protein